MIVPALPLLLALSTQFPPPSTARDEFIVTHLEAVAGGPGARSRPAVVARHGVIRVVWEESPHPLAADPLQRGWRIVGRQLGLDGLPAGLAEIAMDRWPSQGAPAIAAADEGSWLAFHYLAAGTAPGTRDLALVPYRGFFEAPASPLLLTRSPPRGPPVTHSTPALLHDPVLDRLVLAHATGVHRGSPGRPGSPYDSVNIAIMELDPATGRPRHEFLVRGADEVGEASAPALTLLPPAWRERYMLAYLGNGGRRELGAAGQGVHLELYGTDWRGLGGRRMAVPVGGASWPTLATVGGRLYLAWVENVSSDIIITEIDRDLWPRRPRRLRHALLASPLAPRLGTGVLQLDTPVLFDDYGQIGIAFVLTREWNPVMGRVTQEVWVARLRHER